MDTINLNLDTETLVFFYDNLYEIMLLQKSPINLQMFISILSWKHMLEPTLKV